MLNIMHKTQEINEEALTYLTLNCSFLVELGLFHGKMGIAIFFYHYAQNTGITQYKNFADHLLDDIYDEIHSELPLNLENGLCGIGWGIEYLVQHNFVKGNTDEILKHIDNILIQTNLSNYVDLSFRKGLSGIIFYITARLNNPFRNANTACPFDIKYLETLKHKLLKTDFYDEETPENLKDSFFQTLNGIKSIEYIELPKCLRIYQNINLNKLTSLALGLDGGIAGILLSLYHHNFLKHNKIEEEKSISQKNSIYIFSEESRANNYGIGTYIQQLATLLSHTKWNIYIIFLHATQIQSINIKLKNNITYIRIANCQTRVKFNTNTTLRKYYYSIIPILSPFLTNKSIFHLNFLQTTVLATQLKSIYPKSEIIITVHYTEWSLTLLGNREKLQKILCSPANTDFQFIYQGIESNKQLFQLCDRVIAIAHHSYHDLINIYGVEEKKLSLITHGLKDQYSALTRKDKIKKRLKYGFDPSDQILIFAGRIDKNKGIHILVKAFIELNRKLPKLKLIIAGEGDFISLLETCKPQWNNIILTGFIEKELLYDLYSISDIGIIPSIHEEFGYVALEMMMMNLPLIASRTSGLSELIIDKQTGLLFDLNIKDIDDKQNVDNLKQKIFYLLQRRNEQIKYASQGRSRYLTYFTDVLFNKKMLNFYSSLQYNK